MYEKETEDEPKQNLRNEEGEFTAFEKFTIIFSYIIVFLTLPLSLLFCFQVINEYERMIILRLGKLRKGGARGPGLIFMLSCIDERFIVDLRTETIIVDPQQLLTKDSVSIKLEAVIFFKLYDPMRAILAVGNYKYATTLLAQTTLRSIAIERTLIELLLDRTEIMKMTHEMLSRGTEPWGVLVERVEMDDIWLPYDMQRAMAVEAEALRIAKAKMIHAEGERIAANALKYASDIIASSPGALQMRYLQTLLSTASNDSEIYLAPLYKEVLQICKKAIKRL